MAKFIKVHYCEGKKIIPMIIGVDSIGIISGLSEDASPAKSFLETKNDHSCDLLESLDEIMKKINED